MITIKQSLLNHGYLDGLGHQAYIVINTAKYAVSQKIGRHASNLTEKQIIWAYETYCQEIAQAESMGYGCPNP